MRDAGNPVPHILYIGNSWAACGMPCTQNQKAHTWGYTLATIIVFMFFGYQLLKAIQAVAERALYKGEPESRAHLYSKMFELFSNAMGYIIACGILNSARETFITDSISHKFVFVLVLTAVCVCLALAIELLPKVMLMLTDRRRMSHNQTVRFQMIGEKLIGIWLPWILAVAWNQLLHKTLNVARWVLVFHAIWALTCSHAHMLTHSHTHTR
jgi:Mn2+/Fe2+ NRAMP family transporter